VEILSFASRSNLEYLEQMYQQYQKDPNSVDASLRYFFEGMDFGGSFSKSTSTNSLEINVLNLIQTYRDYGHLKANLDPLGMAQRQTDIFELKKFGLSDKDLDTKFQIGGIVGLPGATLRQIIARLEQAYCGTLTAQVSECRPEVAEWFRKELENPDFTLTKEQKIGVFKSLARTESLEKFLQARFVSSKRFSIEGGDALMPMLEHLVEAGVALGMEELTIGMAHRGRVNVLANFMGKALNVILAEFDGIVRADGEYIGDVKYHLGYSCDKQSANGSCHVSLAFNPSHLEIVGPVVMGIARAKQRRRKDTRERKKVVPLLIHGDAAFIGQGVVAETLQMSRLPAYTVGGTVHIIVNNQVGFTTEASEGRSTRYSSDASKAIKAPSMLVNGDDVEACLRALNLAIRFRQKFGEDVVIDLICYRRFGHNEQDEPGFTQPVMYEHIKGHPTLMEIYSKKLLGDGLVDEGLIRDFYKEKIDNLQTILDETRAAPPQVKPNAYEGLWKGLRRARVEDFEKVWPTGIDKKILDRAAAVLISEPSQFHLHPKIKKLIQTRHELYASGKVDWALGELLGYGTLCLEGTPVRVCGQDAKRGTFSHRQAVYFDTENNASNIPLSTLNPEDGEFVIYNSLLSEMAALAFEYGNACSDPTYLTIWEAQFGDFANGAQIVIDQFLSSGEEKWARGCGLTLLLPHGYEGQGAEHSSARLERFLQLCAQLNMQVCNLTTPAQIFHAFRRQVRRDFRKPLIIMSPKSLLRHPKVISMVDELTTGHFQEVIGDPAVKDIKAIDTLILCTGKLYYDLDKYRDENAKETGHVAIVRIEQMYPFPRTQLTPFLNGYPKLQRIIWAQEEPKNMGAYSFMEPHLLDLMAELGQKRLDVEYVGREDRAAPATGSPKVHAREQDEIVKKCFS
jgi:2-oxoglutarate dehydrogenase E1 component